MLIKFIEALPTIMFLVYIIWVQYYHPENGDPTG